MSTGIDWVAVHRLDELRDAYRKYMQAVSTPLDPNATQSVVLKWYKYLIGMHDAVVFTYASARTYASSAQDFAYKAEIQKIVPAGKIPHPNGYLNNEQRAVLVLLDKLEKEET